MKLREAVLFMVVITAFGASAFAQATGSITGVVQDASQARVPGVSVTATNAATGVKTPTVTNESGAYNFSNLAVGPYQLEAMLPGFRTARVANIELRVNETLRYNLVLEVAQVGQQVDVTIDARDVLAISSASVGNVLNESQVSVLPLVGGDVLDLMNTLPGFRQGTGGAAANNDTLAGIASSAINTVRDGLSVSDGRYQNGVFATTVINPDMVGEIRMVMTPVDAEMGRGNGQVQITTRSGTNRYNGAVTWSVRNSALDANTWDRNNDIDARTGQWKPTAPDWQNQNQVTASYGGPILRNKTFFFALFDRNFVRTRAIVNGLVLTDSARQGIFRYFDKFSPLATDATPGTNSLPSVDFQGNPVAPLKNPDGVTNYSGIGLVCFSVFGNQKLNPDTFQMTPFTSADCAGGTPIFPSNTIGQPYWDAGRQAADITGFMKNFLTAMPHANNFQGGDGLNIAQIRWTRTDVNQGLGSPALYVGDSNIERTQFNVKVDHYFSQNHKANVGWTMERDSEGQNFSNWPDMPNGITRRKPWILTSSFTSTLSASMINEARFGVRYQIGNSFEPWESPDAKVREQAKQYLLSDTNGFPTYFATNPGFTGYFTGTTGMFGATNANSPLQFGTHNGNRTPLYSFGDTLSWTRGIHAFKFGGEVRLTKSIGYNNIGPGGTTIPVEPILYAGSGANVASNISSSTGGLTGLVSGGTAAETTARSLLYLLSGSIGSGTQLYWIDDSTDVSNGKWENINTLERKYRDQVQNEFSFFVKDDWKVRPSLTINLGLRWEYYAVPYIGSGFTTTTPGQGRGLFGVGRTGLGDTDPFNRWLTPANVYLSGYGPSGLLECKVAASSGVAGIPASNCDPNLITGVEFVGPNSPNPDKGVFRNDTNNFGPAVGFAWQLPFGRPGQSTLRGGYQMTFGGPGRNGIQLDTVLGGAPGATSLAFIDFSAMGNPYLDLRNVPSLVPLTPTNPAVPGGTLGAPYSRAGSFTAYDPNYTTPYVENFTLSLTHQLRRNITVDVRYAGTQGKKLNGSVNLNTSNVFYNQELFSALETVRQGGEAPLFDQLFAGLNLNVGTPGFGVIGTCFNQPAGSTAPGLGQNGCSSNQVLQTGSVHLRRRFATSLTQGDYVTIANFINSNTGGNPTSGLLSPNAALRNVGGRILRNGCDRLANGSTVVGAAIPTALRCFPEDYLVSNPQFATPNYNSNMGSSNYHSMQTQLTLRPTTGSSLQATYTWARSMETPGTGWTDPLDRDADYRLASNHRAHEFRMNGTFQLPIGPNQLLFGNASGVLARAIEGWRMSWTYNAFSGAPATIGAQSMLYGNGTPDVVGGWNVSNGEVRWGGPPVGTQGLVGGTYFGPVGSLQVVTDPQCAAGGILDRTDAMGTNIRTLNPCPLRAIATPSGDIVLQNPKPGKRGTLGQGSVTGPGSWSLDGSLSKSFRITESKQVQLRFDATNVLNHPNPGAVQYSINNTSFGTISAKGDQRRQFQGQLRLAF
jgi:hypothetical protein